MKSWLAGGMIFVAVLSWTGFGLFVQKITSDRAEYADALSRAEQDSVRGDSAARVRSTVESSVEERAALEKLFAISVLEAVEIVEQSVAAAGARDVVIEDASSSSSEGDLSAVMLVVNANGSFAAVTRAVSLLETLPIPASLEGLEMEYVDDTNLWRLTARIKIYMMRPAL